MRSKLFFVLTAFALILAACGSGATNETTSTATAEPETTTTMVVTEAQAPDAQLLSYALEAGTTFEYEVDITQHLTWAATVVGAAAEEEDIPGEAAIDLSSSAVFTYEVEEGPDEGTYSIRITGEFTDFDVSGTADGEPITSEGEIPEMAELAGLDPIDVTVIVDEQGNIIVDGEAIDDPMAGMFGGFEGMSAAAAPGLDPGQFVGIPFTDEEVTVGDSWSEEIESPGLGEDAIVTTISSTVTGVDEVEGQEVLVIETSSETSVIEFDLGEFFIGLISAFGNPGEDPELDAMLEQIRFLFVIDDASSDSVAYFDSEAGLTRRMAMDSGANVVIDMNIPDEETGELAGILMDMQIDQQIEYRLVGAPAA